MKKIITMFMALAVMAFVASPALAATSVIYDALPSVDPATSYPSQPFQAQQTSEFGDYIHLGETERMLDNVTVTMITWAKFADYSTNESYMGNTNNWTHPITLNVYSSSLGTDGVPNTLLGTVTQNITIPWRPVASDGCTDLRWKDSTGRCNNGYAFNAAFDLSSLNITLPNDIIVTVAFNTQSYGDTPLTVNGPYNSLNVAVPDSQVVTVGSDEDTDATFWDSTYGGRIAGLREDTNWTPYGTVALRVSASAPVSIAKINGGGHLLESNDNKRKDWLDVGFGGEVTLFNDESMEGNFQINLHNVGKDELDKSKFHGTEVTKIDLFDGNGTSCNDAVAIYMNGTLDGESGYSMIFRAGDFGSPNTMDTARVTISHGGDLIYDSHTSGEFSNESNCVGTARTGMDKGNITITRL